ncbi:MAG: peptide deformylase [Candidatus Shikimatogenerans bostrichidophilus]|nr:MAG: peptide deformylase [Candidatus Shikimatogenerans bostrichidophilus]
MILPILLYNNPYLRKKSIKIKKNINLDNLINNMYDTMFYNLGVGLSAIQIGQNINLFIIGYHDEKKTIINPKIIKKSKETVYFKEGCLSIPNVIRKIKRHKNILVTYYNKKWIKKKEKLTNILSIIFQHEYDHLKGKLIIDY